MAEAVADPQMRERTAAAAHIEAHRYDWVNVASQVLAVYETAVQTAQLGEEA